MLFTAPLTVVWIATALAALTPGPASEPAPDGLIAQLGSDDWGQRQAADAALRALQPPGLAALEPFLVRTDLTPEQRTRLHSIALERFTIEPHAALGVSWNNDALRMGVPLRQAPVVIGGTVPGFHADAQLRAGDAIAAMDGLSLANRAEMVAAIISHSPGDTVTLSVFRGPMRLEIAVTLGDLVALRQNDAQRALSPDEPTLARALDLRLERLARDGVAQSPPVVGGWSLAPWNLAAARMPSPTSVPLPGDDEELGGLLVGGEGRGGFPGPGVAPFRPTNRLAPSPGRGAPERPTARPADQRPRPALAPMPPRGPVPPKPAANPPAPRPAPRPGA